MTTWTSNTVAFQLSSIIEVQHDHISLRDDTCHWEGLHVVLSIHALQWFHNECSSTHACVVVVILPRSLLCFLFWEPCCLCFELMQLVQRRISDSSTHSRALTGSLARHTDVCRFLIAQAAKINSNDQDQQTPLMSSEHSDIHTPWHTLFSQYYFEQHLGPPGELVSYL